MPPPRVTNRVTVGKLSTLAEVQQAIATPTRLIVVADREADIYPLFSEPRDERTELVVPATTTVA